MTLDEQSLKEKQPSLPALVESLLFVADEPVEIERLAEALEVREDAVEAALQEMSADGANRGVRLQRKGDRVQLVTRPEAAAHIERFMGLEKSGGCRRPRSRRFRSSRTANLAPARKSKPCAASTRIASSPTS